ncbi:MAG: M28 family peptidase [Gemmatimonadales bacterium]|nr:MAG: M28 family peptidase [Gemmatimonadales bacterium]
MRQCIPILIAAVTLALLSMGPGAAPLSAQSVTGFTAERASQQLMCEASLAEIPSSDRFRLRLQALSAEPNPAGSEANERVAEYLAEQMAAAGFRIDRYPYDLYMPSPESAHNTVVELVTPIRKPLNLQEYILEEDPFSAHPDLGPGWNAYSGSGDVTAEVVYANYGRLEDFQALEAMGVDLTGKIVIARYGGNFRGYKARYAEDWGAAGVLMYTDPADGGYVSGLTYPEGPFVNESGIQRGSVLTPLGGDPLTPHGPALPLDHPDTPARLDPSETSLLTIPVTPLPYGSAVEILERMTGEAVPSGWQGGLPFTYRVTGGEGLTVRLRVEQPLDFVRATNIIGVLEGTEFPDEWVILGSHFDAWTFGATDPNSGSAMLLELADALGQLAGEGCAPRRSIMIAHWDAEEYGILGSLEWVRQLEEELTEGGVAYINADAAATGRNFGASSSPSLKSVILEAARAVPHPDRGVGSVYDHYQARFPQEPEPPIGTLGGGSDHVGFVTYIGMPSANIGMSSPTPIYHTIYDSFAWYERFADPDFVSGPTLATLDGILALRLANADILPYDVARFAADLETHMVALEARARALDTPVEMASLRQARERLALASEAFAPARDRWLADRAGASGDRGGDGASAQEVNRHLRSLEQAFLHGEGLQDQPLSRSLFVSPDPFSGYASWPLPGLRYELETGLGEWTTWLDRYVEAVDRLTRRVEAVNALLAPGDASP